jgi:hypothetical protein
MKVIIPSRRRASTIGRESLALVPDAYVLVDEQEADVYRSVVRKNRLLTHPSLQTLGLIFNFILDLYPREPFAILGDDHTGLYALPGWTPRRLDPSNVQRILHNAAECAHDAGAGLFGFARNANPTIYEPTRPVRLAQWVTSPIGFVPGHGLRFDERLSLMLDVDICLASLLKHRIVWHDARFCFVGKALNNRGGSAHLRSAEAFARERAILKQKWGKYVTFDTSAFKGSRRYAAGLPATTMMTYLNVPRVQGSFS